MDAHAVVEGTPLLQGGRQVVEVQTIGYSIEQHHVVRLR
jgi:hypothetical protein